MDIMLYKLEVNPKQGWSVTSRGVVAILESVLAEILCDAEV